MPRRKFAIEPGGQKRLEVSWGRNFSNTRVTLDGQPIGAPVERKELREGVSYPLPDGSTLGLRTGGMYNAELQVTRNGTPVPGSASDPRQRMRTAAGVFAFIGGLSILVGLIAQFMAGDTLRSVGFGWTSVVFGVVFAAIAFFVLRGSFAALLIGIALYTVDTVMSFVAVASAGANVPIGSYVVRVLLFFPLIQGIPAARQLRRLRSGDPTTGDAVAPMS